MDIKDFMIEKEGGNCLGDIWANNRISLVFNDINLQNDNRFIVSEIYKYIKCLREECCHNNWIQDTLNVSEAKKLNAIMKCKNKETLKKKLTKFYYTIQEDQYDWLFHSKKIKAWQNILIELQDKEKLWGNLPEDYIK